MIVGGESGPGARPMAPDWVLSIRDQCRVAKVPFFFKQWGGVRKAKTGRKLDGRTYDHFPRIDRGPIPSKGQREHAERTVFSTRPDSSGRRVRATG